MGIIGEYLIVLWGFLLIILMGIGGFFMFRKFLKQLPKQDGHSNMDWETYYVNETKYMWGKDQKLLLEELVSPVPELFRDVARHRIVGKIGEVALAKQYNTITSDILIEGYILATPKRDHKFLRKKLKEKEINVAPYEHLFPLSRSDYAKNWRNRYNKNI
ncbi:DUF2621 domain-containing protein [Barrientosiimonas marina]|uniref:DUF2621 family protein n=1 Tax=Lentibacillus kimchii TaxID=1542911 RepID=A0ABW2UWM6_9BACI